MSSSIARVLVLFAATVLLPGCDPMGAPESMLDEYVLRVARVLEGDAELTPVPTAPQLPRRRERVRELSQLDIGMLDFLGLYGCELQHVIGERNSVLGRVMHPAGLFDYELRFVRAADECVGEISSERLAQRITEATDIKRADLPDVAWNAIWGSSEIEDFLTRSRGALAIAHDRDMSATMGADLRALEHAIGRIAGGNLDVDVKSFDPVYQRWQSRPLAGQVIRSAILVATRLDDASALIEARLGDRPVCAKPTLRPRRAESMHGMFLSVYVGNVQPYLADVQRVRRDLIPPLQALSRIGDSARSPTVAAYARAVLSETDENSVWLAFDDAVKRHTLAWQALLGQCGMRPGQEIS